MPLTLPAALDAAVRFEVQTLAHLIEITRQDGFVLRLTDCDFDLVVDGLIYRSDIGFTASALLIGMNLQQAQGMTLDIGLKDDGITKNDLRMRRYDAADVLYYECDFTQPTDSKLLLFKGRIGRGTYKDTGGAQLEVLPFTDDTVQFADEVYQQSCRHNLGDTRCRFPILAFAVNFTVTRVGSGTSFFVDTFGPTAAGRPDEDYFSQGQLKWLTGDNTEWASDIISGDFATKNIKTFFPCPIVPKAGDTGIMYPGCDMQLSTCLSKFDNVFNFGGEPYAPQWSI
jgi:uncharacterized phage protein (TIGR02218 family)